MHYARLEERERKRGEVRGRGVYAERRGRETGEVDGKGKDERRKRDGAWQLGVRVCLYPPAYDFSPIPVLSSSSAPRYRAFRARIARPHYKQAATMEEEHNTQEGRTVSPLLLALPTFIPALRGVREQARNTKAREEDRGSVLRGGDETRGKRGQARERGKGRRGGRGESLSTRYDSARVEGRERAGGGEELAELRRACMCPGLY